MSLKATLAIMVSPSQVKEYLQSYANLDIILIDDKSIDESLNLALEFSKKASLFFRAFA